MIWVIGLVLLLAGGWAAWGLTDNPRRRERRELMKARRAILAYFPEGNHLIPEIDEQLARL